jgi:high-affinity iron transporter
MDFSAAIPTFVITLREGVEATLVVGIVLAILAKANQRQLIKWVYLGVIAGIFLSSIFGALAQALIGGFSGQVYYLTKSIFSLAAIAMLSWMLMWMTQHAKMLKKDIEGTVGNVLTNRENAGWAILGMITVAVLREGAEVVLFIAGALTPDSSQIGLAKYAPALGAVFGILCSVIIGVAIFKLGVKINIKLFFQILGILLLLIVSGLVISTLAAFDLANTIDKVLNPTTGAYEFLNPPQKIVPWFNLGTQVTDTTAILPQDKFPGILLATMFGYSDKLYAVQLVAYFIFLFSAGTIYFRTLAGRPMFILRNSNSSSRI